MAQAPGLCADCFRGVRHEGDPEGTIEYVDGVECYVATPTGDYAKDTVLLFLHDAFGLPFVNNRLLADDFARNGFKTIMPDLFTGDPGTKFDDPSFDRDAWVGRHGREAWAPIVDKVVASLKENGVTKIGTTGYCFGGGPSFYLALKNESQAVVLAHPALFVVPDDLEKYKAESKAPILINSCETDSQFPPAAQKIADELLGGGAFVPGYERTYWAGCTHGFAVRGDLSDPRVKAGKEGAFKASVEFLKKHLSNELQA